MLDRILLRSAIVNINGESFRLKDKRKAGLLTASAKSREALVWRLLNGNGAVELAQRLIENRAVGNVTKTANM
jgi:hypothetical protein